jgi:Zn-dependent protease/predicted transcriptional regulator
MAANPATVIPSGAWIFDSRVLEVNLFFQKHCVEALMKWRISIGRYAGIEVYIHITFFLLLMWIAFVHWTQGNGWIGAVGGMMFILAVFACVVLHEFGHALAARAYGIETRDIILLPIGGVARLERMPREPVQEIYVALAGPAVNLIIAGGLFALLWITNTLAPFGELTVASGPFFERLMMVNLFLLLFNLIPAFPMDGGRVLRAALAMRGNYVQATQRAAQIGQGIALLFGLAGLMAGNPMLVFVALFVWIGAAQEASMTKMSTALVGVPVSHAMITDFKVLNHDDELTRAVALTMAGSQNDFPVLKENQVVGVLTQKNLISSLKSDGERAAVGDVMQRSFVAVNAEEMLDVSFGKLSECQCHTLPVLHDDRLVGLLTMDNVGEFIRIQTALKSRPSYRDLPN